MACRLRFPLGDDTRLALPLVGQLASPRQGALARPWQLHKPGATFPVSLDPIQVLHTQRRLLLRDDEQDTPHHNMELPEHLTSLQVLSIINRFWYTVGP